MIYTTYFARLKYLPENVVPISICGKAPDWYKGLEYKKLAPKYDFFKEWKKNHDNDYFIKCFNEQVLGVLNARSVIEDLENLTGHYVSDIALVCYEKSTDFCHRHLVREWLIENNFKCKEFEV